MDSWRVRWDRDGRGRDGGCWGSKGPAIAGMSGGGWDVGGDVFVAVEAATDSPCRTQSEGIGWGGGTQRAVPAPPSCAEGIGWGGRFSVRPQHLPRAGRTQSPHWVAMQAQIPGQEMWGASVGTNDIHQ